MSAARAAQLHPVEALAQVDGALALQPHDPRLLLQRAHCLLALGQTAAATQAAGAAREHASDPALLDAAGTLLSVSGDQEGALRAYERAIALAPDQPHLLFNRATVRRYLGRLEEAERDYDRVIALKPNDYEAHRNRSELRTQTAERNHTGELTALLAKLGGDWRGEVELHHALAKEYEDLGEYERSFQHLARGARTRRAHIQYDVGTDVATADWIMEAFTEATVAQPQAEHSGPIFIVGLPRSGSTLVDRILGSHSDIVCAGELPQFALALMDAVRRRSGRAHLERRELVAQSAGLDFATLGRSYLERVRAAGIAAARFTDKMPLNYLYCGLIQRALPNARIVHVSRSPLAACYAIYKTLFKDGYPFSYDLCELGRYYVAYRRLMQHWERLLPASIYSLRYEDLVADQLGQTRKLLDFCGLTWQDACADFHLNPAPSTTASAAQVRRKLYDTSVSQWRHYQRQLEPLRRQLRAAGIDPED
jgi:tetratricopeptide (TPR) repeat protein